MICLFPVSVFSQVNLRGGMDEDTEEQEEKTEIKSQIRVWELQGFGAFKHIIEIDTMQEGIQIFNPIYKNAITNTYTGNYGGAYENNNFFARNYNTDFLLFQTHDAYLLTPKNIIFYNTTTPYTLLDYSQSENKNLQNETRFNVLHTQNVTPDLNVTFRFDQARSEGQYNDQENKNNSITLYTSYHSDHFNIHGGFISNRIVNGENGGMKDDNQLFEDFKLFNLVNARSSYKNTSFYTISDYRLGEYIDTASVDTDENVDSLAFKPRYSFLHFMEYSSNLRQFIEDDEANSEFFPVTLIDSTKTGDSVRFNKFTNIFQAQQLEDSTKKYSFGKRAFMGFDLSKVVYPGYEDSGSYEENYHDLFVGGGIFRETGKFWNWNIEAKFYITGYHSGQTQISGVIYKPLTLLRDSAAFIEITGKLENRVPDYFQHRYNSNHYTWYNSFNHEQRMTAGVRFYSKKHKLELGANYALINNFVYNDTLGIPAQTKKELLILSAYLNKKFELGNFIINSKLLAQKSSSEEFIHLPDFSSYVGIYYKLLVSKVLHMHIGADLRYNTKYYADAYNPATGFFYLQNEKEIGNYPYIDAYASLKLKRTRVYFKLINVGSRFLNGEYFTALHHPMNKMTFRLGVDWKFYD
ncbi:MAG: putative porin [Prolixibacteraceae bacterium]|nr:putative porin [Prolixibacteraceae bacterium]